MSKKEIQKNEIKRINSAILSLINLSELVRFKNVEIKTTFCNEFFKKMKNYIRI